MAGSRRWLPGLLVAAAIVAAASAAGAQVDPAPDRPVAVWAASCVGEGPSELVAYGRGWGDGAVTLTVGEAVVGSATAASGVFQTRVTIAASPSPDPLVLTATQGGASAGHEIEVSGSCSPAITAAAGGPACVAASQLVPVDLTVDRPGPGRFSHYVDLYGPAEAINRSQPPAGAGTYTLTILVRNVPGRVVPVTVEAESSTGFTFATTNVKLPPACAGPATTASTAASTTAPAASATTAPPTTAAPPAAPATTLPPVVAPPVFGTPPSPTSLLLSPALGQAGQATTVTGTGFGPSAAVILRWRPGIGQWTVTAGGDGSFRTQVLVLPDDVEGPRVLEAVGAVPASASYLVVPGSGQPAFGGVFLRG